MIYKNAIIVGFEDKTEALSATHVEPLAFEFKDYYVTENDTLFSIAHKLYQDTARWYDVALLNPLIDPIEVPINTLLKVPIQ